MGRTRGSPSRQLKSIRDFQSTSRKTKSTRKVKNQRKVVTHKRKRIYIGSALHKFNLERKEHPKIRKVKKRKKNSKRARNYIGSALHKWNVEHGR